MSRSKRWDKTGPQLIFGTSMDMLISSFGFRVFSLSKGFYTFSSSSSLCQSQKRASRLKRADKAEKPLLPPFSTHECLERRRTKNLVPINPKKSMFFFWLFSPPLTWLATKTFFYHFFTMYVKIKSNFVK